MSQRIEIHQGITSLEAEWEELSAKLDVVPFLRPGWVSAWWAVFGSGQMTVLALRRDGRLAAVLPVSKKRGVVVSPTNWHTPVYGPVVENDAARLTLFEYILRDSPRRIDLSFLDAESPDLKLLRRAAGSREIAQRVVMRSPYVPIDSDWDSYWAGLSKNLRKTVRRLRNRLEELGEVTFEVSDGSEKLDQLLEEGFRIEATGWKGEQGTAIMSRRETDRFYRSVSRWAAEQGLLRLAFLRVDGRRLAFHLSIETDKRHYVLKLGHDAEFDSLGPGTILISERIAQVFDLGLERFEFLGHVLPYKLRWTSECRELVRAQAFASSVPGRLDRLVHTRGRDAAKRLSKRGRNRASSA